jgi:fructosamine-3-kinase
MYQAEADGLAWLRGISLRVPDVISVDDAHIELEWLDLADRVDDAAFGRGLAQLHASGAAAMGHTSNNFISVLPQDNTVEADIVTFYCERRLRPLARRLEPMLHERIDMLADRASLFGPPERPARLHGDLWSGNVGSVDGAPVIFDPSVYGGHREIDLAMLQLFGSISSRFVDAYSEVWPLQSDWRERTSLWQLYPIGVHAVLFGGGYMRQLLSTFDDVLA